MPKLASILSVMNCLAFVLLCGASVAHAQTSALGEALCAGEGKTKADYLKCLTEEAQRSEKELKEEEFLLQNALDAQTTDDLTKKANAARIAASSKEFESYRNAQCNIPAALKAGEPSAKDRFLSCLIELTQNRAADLEALRESVEK